MASTTAQYATGQTASSGTGLNWTNPANAVGSTTANFAVWTSTTRSITGWLLLSFGDLRSSIPAGSTIDSVTVVVKHYENTTQTNVLTGLDAQLYSGASTALGSAQNLTRSTTTTFVNAALTFSGASTPTYAQLADLRVRIAGVRGNSTTSTTVNVDYVTVVVNYTEPPPPVDPPPAAGQGAARFDAATDALKSLDPIAGNSSLTVTCWARMEVNRGTYSCLWSLDTDTTARTGFSAYTGSDGAEIRIYDDDDQGHSVIGAPLAVGVWTRLAFTWDATTATGTIYWGGETGALSSASAAQHGPLAGQDFTEFRLGGHRDFSGEWFNGSLAAVKVWSTKLSQAEIEAEFTQYAPVRSTDLNRYYPLFSDIDDRSGNGRHLSAGSSPVSWVAGPAILANIFSKRITDETDDGYAAWGMLYNTFQVAWGSDYGAPDARSFFRFAGVDVPKGATITNATLTINRGYADIGTLSAQIRGAAADDYAAPAFAAQVTNQELTTAFTTVTSSREEWIGRGTYNVTSVVAEIMSRPGWASGNALGLLTVDTGSIGNSYYELSGAGPNGAILTIDYATSQPPPPKIETLTDDFSTKDTVKWIWGAAASVSNGQLHCVSNGDWTGSVETPATYSLTGSSAHIQVVDVGNAANGDAYFSLGRENGDEILWEVWGSKIYAVVRVGGPGNSTELWSATYDPSVHKWWRIRESGGTLFLDTSVDGLTWTQRASWIATWGSSDGFKVWIGTGDLNGPGGTAIFDNLNVQLPAVQPSGVTLLAGSAPVNGVRLGTMHVNELRVGSTPVYVKDLIAIDTFDRPNSSVPGNANTGQQWTLVAGGLSIVNGTAAPLGSSDIAVIDSGVADFDISADATFDVLTGIIGLAFHTIDGGNRWSFYSQNGNLILGVNNGAILTTRATKPQPIPVVSGETHHFRVISIGDKIYCYFDGALIHDYTMTTAEATKYKVSRTVGFRAATNGGTFDNFVVKAVTSTGEPAPVRPYLNNADWLWTPIPASPVLDPNSAAMATKLAESGKQRVLNMRDYGTTVVDKSQITGSTPRYNITFTAGWGNPFGSTQVPIPNGTPVPPGSDGHVAVDDPQTGKMFNLWQANFSGTTKTASYGAMVDSNGDGRETVGSSTGSGLARMAGVIRVKEMQDGEIPHALFFSTDIATAGTSNFRYPATKTDGSNMAGSPVTIPEGARIQLDPSINVDALPITAAEKIIAKALQKYGAYCGDNGGSRLGFIAEYEAGTSPGPTYRAKGITWDYFDMAGIPWSSLRVLRNWDGS